MNSKKVRLAIFASGSGSNAEEIFKYFEKHPTIEVAVLLSNNAQAYALERARKFNIPTRVFTRQQFRDSDEVVQWLKEDGVTHVVLAGFLWLIPQQLIQAYPDKIVNIHPSLLPKFGGKGMYGMKVHQSVKEQRESESGITIHIVNEHYDEGRILFQGKCTLTPDDTPEQIAAKVHQLEYAHYPRVIEEWAK